MEDSLVICTRNLMEYREGLKIVGFTTVVAVVYGVAHDLITAHVCPDYFLPPYHPLLIDTRAPLLLALLWGFVATFWMGGILGLGLGLVAQLGTRPKLTLAQLRRPLLLTMVAVWGSAMSILLVLHFITLRVAALEPKVTEINRRLVIVGITHAYSYAAAAIAGIGLAVYVLRRRMLSA